MGSRAQRESEQSGLNGWAIAAGIACGLVGAVAGAVGHHYLTKNEEQPQQHSGEVCDKKYTDGMCAICQASTDEILLLPCGHEYHKSCILEMRANMRKMFCPKCREPIPDSFLQK